MSAWRVALVRRDGEPLHGKVAWVSQLQGEKGSNDPGEAGLWATEAEAKRRAYQENTFCYGNPDGMVCVYREIEAGSEEERNLIEGQAERTRWLLSHGYVFRAPSEMGK